MNLASVLITLIAFVHSFNFSTVTSSETIIEPFKIDERALSGLDIPQQQLQAHPNREYFQKQLYAGSDLSVFILSSETADNEISNFPIDEFVFYMNGRADIRTSDQDEYSFYAGDYLFVPKGFSGNWINNGGSKYHLELSVISNKRSDANSISTAENPFLLDRELISGIGLSEQASNGYRDVLHSGVELEVVTESELPADISLSDTEKEQFIHVLQGMVTITPSNGEAHTFYTGDFFILPKGFNGQWKSEAQHLFRTLRVVQK